MLGWQAADLCPSRCHLTTAFSTCAEPCSVPGSVLGIGHTAMSKPAHPQPKGALRPAVDSCPVGEAVDEEVKQTRSNFTSPAPAASPAPAQGRGRPARRRHVSRVASELLTGLRLIPSEMPLTRRQGFDSRPQLCPGKPWEVTLNIPSFGIIWIYSIRFTSSTRIRCSCRRAHTARAETAQVPWAPAPPPVVVQGP